MSEVPLLSSEKPQRSSEKTRTYDVIQALFFMVAFSTGLGLLGSTDSLIKFGIDSLLADFLVMIVVIVTYAVNYHMMAYCCKKSTEKFNYAEYLEDIYGKVPAMIYDILMTAHNLIMLSYIQQYIGGYLFGRVGYSSTNYDISYYSLALINIPLIVISLTSDFKRVKWFCIALILGWIYIFTGSMIETIDKYSGSQFWSNVNILAPLGAGTWLLKLVGLQIYFASAFQSVPFIFQEVRHINSMRKVINYSSFISLLVYFSVYVFYTFNTIKSTEYGRTQVYNYEKLKSFGLVLVGACAVIVNVIPARFSLAQFLAGNDAENMKKSSAQDKFLSVILIMSSIILSLFMVNKTTWDIMIGTGIILSSVLGVALPPIAIMSSERFKRIFKSDDPEDKKYKIALSIYLTWAISLGLAGVCSGFFIMIEKRVI